MHGIVPSVCIWNQVEYRNQRSPGVGLPERTVHLPTDGRVTKSPRKPSLKGSPKKGFNCVGVASSVLYSHVRSGGTSNVSVIKTMTQILGKALVTHSGVPRATVKGHRKIPCIRSKKQCFRCFW